ncbi:MAG: hypothetical protein IJC46_07835 [Clostridia bacterium]|nr:hypothetical protein [Clostridia bacterium]
MFSTARNYRKFILYVILTLVCFLLQSVPAFGVRFLGCAPSLLLLLTAAVAFFESPTFSAWYGLTAGLLSQLTTSRLVGTDGIIFMFAGFFIAVLLQIYFKRRFLVYLAVAMSLLVIQQLFLFIFYVMIWDTITLKGALMGQILPTFFFTGPFAFPMYYILWRSDRKFRAKEELENDL